MAVDEEEEGKSKHKDAIHLSTEIDLSKLCECQGQGGKEFTLNIKISTTSERIMLEQDIMPFEEVTGDLKIVSVEKKPTSPPSQDNKVANKIYLKVFELRSK